MHFDAFHHQVSDFPPALPARSLRKVPNCPLLPLPIFFILPLPTSSPPSPFSSSCPSPSPPLTPFRCGFFDVNVAVTMAACKHTPVVVVAGGSSGVTGAVLLLGPHQCYHPEGCRKPVLSLELSLWFSLSHLPQSPLHPIPASPTSPQSAPAGSSSNLSGSASSGVSSLSDSNVGGPVSSSIPPACGTDALESVPSSQAWSTPPEDLDCPYQPVRYSISEPDVLGGAKPPPCRSQSAPGGANPAQDVGHFQPQVLGLALTGAPPHQGDGPPYLQPHYHLYQHFYPHYLPHQPPLYQLHEPPPALPPKPMCIPEEAPLDSQRAPALPTPRPPPRKTSQPVVAATKDEQAKVAWEHGISEE